MSEKLLVLIPVLCISFLLISQVNCWNNVARQLPCWPEKLTFDTFDMKGYFSSRNEKDQLIKPGYDLGPNGLDFDPRRRTTIIVHGFGGNAHDKLLNILRDNLLIWQDMNVIAIDWNKGSTVAYQQAARNTEFTAINISLLIGLLIDFWKKRNVQLTEWGQLHLIGFSLGAHIAGQAAELIKKEHNLNVHRVTGLDPAEPCFEKPNPPLHLTKSSARFVDVIHTDAALSLNAAFGLREPIGHVDFYVNGGSIQPGCAYQSGKRIINFIQLAIHSNIENGACHHVRAVQVFVDSIKQATFKGCTFWGRPWRLGTDYQETQRILQSPCNATTCPEMGINAEYYTYNTNTFYVSTANKSPFCHI